MDRERNTRRVVVTGYGAVTALGGNAQQNWQAIMANRLAYRYHDKSAAGIHARFLLCWSLNRSWRALPDG